ncbi:hypothetical protein MRZ76_00090 [bacterium]|nr:hypothetical protein [bacterium]
MNATDIISLVMSLIGVGSFCAVFTILFAKYTKSSIRETQEGKRDIELIDQEITEQDMKTKRRRKVVSIAGNVIFYSFLALIIPLFGIALVNKVKGNLVGIGDEAMIVVASGSMSYKNDANKDYLEDEEKRKEYNLDNQFSRYDILFVKGVKEESDVHLYDVIAFYNVDAKAIYIHRVIKIDSSSNGTTRYTTRGDANNANDPKTIGFSDIKGVYQNKKINGLGMIILFFQSPHGIITVLSVVYSIWMFNHYAGKIEKSEKQRTSILSAIVSDVSLGKQKDLFSNFVETIYYGGFAYRFNEKGFLGKEETNQPADGTLRKVVEIPSGSASKSYDLSPSKELTEEEGSRYDEDDLMSDLEDSHKDY